MTVDDASPCPVCGAESRPERRFGPAPLRRCGSCTYAFLDDEGEQSSALYADAYFKAYAGGDYETREDERRGESRVRLDFLARWVPPPARLLEIGAAAGFFLGEAVARGYTGSGIEPNERMAAVARERQGVDVAVAVVEEAELETGGFDAVCAWHVVEHLPDPLADLRRAATALRPGGHLLVEVPNIASAAARRRGEAWPALDLPYHVGQHTPRSLGTLLERAGFDVLLIETVPFATYDPLVLRWGRGLALARAAAESVRARVPVPVGPHPTRQQLLRAVGRLARP